MTRPIRNTGPCFPSGLPRQRGQRDVLSHTEFYTPIFCMLCLPGHPLRVTEKATHGEQVGLYSLHSRMGTSITVNIVPKCEVCPRDHGKVVESLRGRILSIQILALLLENASNKIIFQIFAFLIIVAGL